MDVLKKRLALFCAILLLLVPLASCGTKTEKPKSTETATTTGEEDQTEEIRNDVDDLPDDLDFEQHTIRLFSYVQSETVREMLQEESGVNVVQDAMVKRNLNLEDRLNCRIEVYERVGDYDYRRISYVWDGSAGAFCQSVGFAFYQHREGLLFSRLQ